MAALASSALGEARPPGGTPPSQHACVHSHLGRGAEVPPDHKGLGQEVCRLPWGLQGLECLSPCLVFPSALGSDTTPLPSWAPLSSSTWESLKQALKGLSVEFALLADRAVQQVSEFVLVAPAPEDSLCLDMEHLLLRRFSRL